MIYAGRDLVDAGRDSIYVWRALIFDGYFTDYLSGNFEANGNCFSDFGNRPAELVNCDPQLFDGFSGVDGYFPAWGKFDFDVVVH